MSLGSGPRFQKAYQSSRPTEVALTLPSSSVTKAVVPRRGLNGSAVEH